MGDYQIIFIFILFIGLLASGMAVPFAILLPGMLYLYLQGGLGALHGLGLTSWGSMDSYTLTSIPLFVLMAEILQGSDLADRLGDKARTLSGGQLRRVEIVRAFMHSPRLILLDEPTVGLDIGSRAEIVAEVRRLVRQEGVSVLWATHLIDEIEESDRVVVLHHGKVLAEGHVADIVEEQRAETVRDAFASLTGLVRLDAAPAAEFLP